MSGDRFQVSGVRCQVSGEGGEGEGERGEPIFHYFLPPIALTGPPAFSVRRSTCEQPLWNRG